MGIQESGYCGLICFDPQEVLAKEPTIAAVTDDENDNAQDSSEPEKKVKPVANDASPLWGDLATLSADASAVDEDLAAAFQSGMLALMGKIHHNHLAGVSVQIVDAATSTTTTEKTINDIYQTHAYLEKMVFGRYMNQQEYCCS